MLPVNSDTLLRVVPRRSSLATRSRMADPQSIATPASQDSILSRDGAVGYGETVLTHCRTPFR